MERLRTESSNVRLPCDVVAQLCAHDGVVSAATEARLAGACTHYTLGGAPFRMGVTDLIVVREVLAQAYQHDDVSFWESGCRLPLIRPCLVASIKNCFVADALFRARLVFDLDCRDTTEIGTFPGFDGVRRVLVDWLAVVAPNEHGDWDDERVVMFVGSFDDKNVSVHMYFVDVCWEPIEQSRFRHNLQSLALLNAELRSYNLQADPSISSSGLKLPFCDKFLRNGVWRGAVMTVGGQQGLTLPLQWSQLAQLCDPLAQATDIAFARTVSFTPAAPSVRRQQPHAALVRIVHAAGDTVAQRLIAVFAPWRDVQFKRITQTHGKYLLVPQSNKCPLKTDATDVPALEHGGVGKCYIAVDAVGRCVIHCHICVGRTLAVEGAPIESGLVHEIVARFNAEWALMPGELVMRLPVELTDGTQMPYAVLKQRSFISQVQRLGESIKLHGKNLKYGDIWLQHPGANRFDLGLVCDPTGILADYRQYNTWSNFNPRTLRTSETMSTLSIDELCAYFPNWLSMLYTNICANDDNLYGYALAWMAHMVQQPGFKPGVALVFHGSPGCGKGLTVQMLLKMLGKPYAVQVGSGDLTGNFNNYLAERVLVFADEAVSAREKDAQSKLKQLVTESELVVREKYLVDRTARTFQRFIFASNNPDAVYYQAGERRFAVFAARFRLHERNSPDEIAFRTAVAAETENVLAHGALYQYLLRFDISQWQPSLIPESRGMWELQYESLSSYEKFIYRVLQSGHLTMRDYVLDGTGFSNVSKLIEANHMRGIAACDPLALGYNVFDARRIAQVLPADLMTAAFAQQFPRQKDGYEGALWRQLYELVDAGTWKRTRARFEGGLRLQVFTMPDRDVLQRAFLLRRGNVDMRIFGEWGIQ